MAEEKLLNAKMEHYSFEPLNFKAEGELMVTITLDEYRGLVRESARYDMILSKYYDQIKDAEKEAAQLRERIRDLQERLEKECSEDVRDVPTQSLPSTLP